MRILKIIPYYYPELKFGGPPLKVHSFARGIQARGPEVTVLTFDSEQPARSDRICLDGITVQYLPWSGQGLRQFPRDTQLIRNEVAHCDVAHVYGLYTTIAPLAVRACIQQKKPYLSEPLGMYPARFRNIPAKTVYNTLVTGWMFRHAEKIIATSPPEQADLARKFPAHRITIRRNGIDIAQFQNLPPRERFLERHALDPRKRYLTFLGRISPIKNLEAAIEAFKIAQPENCDFLLVGPALEDDYTEKLKSCIRRLDLDDRVHLLPPVYRKEKLEVFAASDLVILPSLNESFGNSAGEAVAAGIPVLVTTGCGIADIVHEKAGLAVAPDAEGIATGLTQLLDDSNTAAASTNRIAEVTRELSWDEPIEEALSLYQQTLNHDQRTAREGMS